MPRTLAESWPRAPTKLERTLHGVARQRRSANETSLPRRAHPRGVGAAAAPRFSTTCSFATLDTLARRTGGAVILTVFSHSLFAVKARSAEEQGRAECKGPWNTGLSQAREDMPRKPLRAARPPVRCHRLYGKQPTHPSQHRRASAWRIEMRGRAFSGGR
jgi:hypothetical protein